MVENRLREALSTLWVGKCTVKELSQWTDFMTKTAQMVETPTITDEPCRVSYGSSSSANPTETVTIADQEVTLFTRPDIEIKAGSRITVTQNGRTVDYMASGQPKVYSSHQEVALKLWDDKA